MSTMANLLARKQSLLERLKEDPGPHERDQIERLIEQVDTALNLLEDSGQDDSDHDRSDGP
ncbi:hypothetical protein NLM33_05010 [Bradyrhizobium sp. CCGUVB1N3]|nr:hypothetical protein [Bradyrhizobium sp. CCGUVB1N3]MCP3469688.1 hypothetical protein [Bradyrhizobium sp. CCGUVB1N3]